MFMAIRAVNSQVVVFMMIFSRGHGHLKRVSFYNRIITQTPLHQMISSMNVSCFHLVFYS